MAGVTKSVIIFGGTGIIGRYIVDEILKANKFSVAIFTSPGTVEGKNEMIESLKKRSCRVIVGDVRKEQDVKAAYKGRTTKPYSLSRLTFC